MVDSIKLVSFNIEYCAAITKGYYQYLIYVWKYIVPHNINTIWHIAELINDNKIDICTFMEIDGGSVRTRHTNYLTVISELTPLKNNVFFPVHRFWWNLTNQGNGIATRYQILEVKNVKLKANGEGRYLSISKLKLPSGKAITVMTTQLSLGKISRVKQLKVIADTIKETKGPIIFTGDLNTHNENELEILGNTGLKRLETGQTFPSWAPKKRLDYVYYSSDFELVDGHVVNYMKVSDHLPIIVEFKLKK